MKRFICLITAFAMLFTLASCSVNKLGETADGETVTTTAKPPKVKEITKNAEFKDANGRVVFTVDVVIPEISKNAEQRVIDYVNKVTGDIFEEASTFAQNNVENAARFMDKHGSDVPWSKKINFEATYMSGRFVCFLIKDSFSSSAAEAEPLFSTICFDIVSGQKCTAEYFAANAEDFSAAEAAVLSAVKEKALYDFYPNSIGLANIQLEMLDGVFDINNFYIAEEGMGFYFDRYLLDSSQSGTYRCVIPWAELEGLFIHPEAVQ